MGVFVERSKIIQEITRSHPFSYKNMSIIKKGENNNGQYLKKIGRLLLTLWTILHGNLSLHMYVDSSHETIFEKGHCCNHLIHCFIVVKQLFAIMKSTLYFNSQKTTETRI